MGILTNVFKNTSNSDLQKSAFAQTCSKCGCNLRSNGKAYHQDGKGGWECMDHVEVPPKEKSVSDYKEELENEILEMIIKFSNKHNVTITRINLMNVNGEGKVKITAEV
jgi:meiotically up-regulated gene 157 (Mug157) protein